MSEPSLPTSSAPDQNKRPRPRRPRVFRDFIETIFQPEFRPIFASVVAVLLSGTLIFRELEGWSLLDSLYFSVVTLATIGYGDLTPTTSTAKLFSIFYILVGVGVLGVFISAVSHASMQRTLDRHEQHAGSQVAAREKHLEHEL